MALITDFRTPIAGTGELPGAVPATTPGQDETPPLTPLQPSAAGNVSMAAGGNAAGCSGGGGGRFGSSSGEQLIGNAARAAAAAAGSPCPERPGAGISSGGCECGGGAAEPAISTGSSTGSNSGCNSESTAVSQEWWERAPPPAAWPAASPLPPLAQDRLWVVPDWQRDGGGGAVSAGGVPYGGCCTPPLHCRSYPPRGGACGAAIALALGCWGGSGGSAVASSLQCARRHSTDGGPHSQSAVCPAGICQGSWGGVPAAPPICLPLPEDVLPPYRYSPYGRPRSPHAAPGPSPAKSFPHWVAVAGPFRHSPPPPPKPLLPLGHGVGRAAAAAVAATACAGFQPPCCFDGAAARGGGRDPYIYSFDGSSGEACGSSGGAAARPPSAAPQAGCSGGDDGGAAVIAPNARLAAASDAAVTLRSREQCMTQSLPPLPPAMEHAGTALPYSQNLPPRSRAFGKLQRTASLPLPPRRILPSQLLSLPSRVASWPCSMSQGYESGYDSGFEHGIEYRIDYELAGHVRAPPATAAGTAAAVTDDAGRDGGAAAFSLAVAGPDAEAIRWHPAPAPYSSMPLRSSAYRHSLWQPLPYYTRYPYMYGHQHVQYGGHAQPVPPQLWAALSVPEP